MYTVIYKDNGIVKQTAPFQTKEEAEGAAAELQADGYQAIVRKIVRR